MKELIIKFQPFIFKQLVFIKDGRKITQQEVPPKELASFISLCEGIDTVHFFGNQKYAERIAEECKCKYNIKTKNIKFVFNK